MGLVCAARNQRGGETWQPRAHHRVPARGGFVPLPPERGPLPSMMEPPQQTASADVIEHGMELFRGPCAMCHADRANGMTPDLRSMPPVTHQAIRSIVLGGALRQLGMPQWDDVFSDADVKAIHAYLIGEAWKVCRDEAGASPVEPSRFVH